MLLPVLLLACQGPLVPPPGPAELAGAFAEARLDPASHPVRYQVSDRVPDGGFVLRSDGQGAEIEASGPRGLLYGTLELAERLRSLRAEAFAPGTVEKRPFLRERGLAVALSLPWDPEEHRTITDPAARMDPGRWWFQDDAWWASLLDSMARSRLDWLHLLPPWDVFEARAVPFAEIFEGQDGAATACRERLRAILAGAHARAIRVSLDPGAEGPAAAELHRLWPELDRVRRGAGATGGADPDAPLGVPFNGGHLGPAWPIAGGRTISWPGFSYGNAFSEPADGAPGRPVLWEVRAGGSLRIFPWYDPDFVRRAVRTVAGFSERVQGLVVELPGCHDPRSPEDFLAQPQPAYRWLHERDAFFLGLWGRLAFDPDDPLEDLESGFTLRYGVSARSMLDAWRAASRVLPLWMAACGLGPDRSFMQPELETGDSLPRLVTGEPLDSQVYVSAATAFAIRATGGRDGRQRPLEVADQLLQLRERILLRRIRRVPGLPDADEGFLRELAAAESQLASLAAFHAARLRAAWALLAAEVDPLQAPTARAELARQAGAARVAWEALSESPEAAFYKPFAARRRMRAPAWHWRSLVGVLRGEARRFGGAAALAATEAVPEGPSAFPGRGRPPEDVRLFWKDDRGVLRVRVTGEDVEKAWLLHKPLPSTTCFHPLPMRRELGRFIVDLERRDWGHQLAAEVQVGGRYFRIPWPEDATPWVVVPPRPRPTAPLYGVGEALAHLDPAILDPERHGALVLGPRAWQFFHAFPVEEQRKLLDAVARGLDLLVLDQEWGRRGYVLDWLPEAPGVLRESAARFDPDGVLGLEPVEANGILATRFLPSPGWTVHGNGGMAERPWGRGRIRLVQARLVEARYLPAAARDLVALLRHATGGGQRPLILVDPGSEGARHAQSVLSDLAAAHDLPFLTLGEVLAAERGLAAAERVPPRAWEDRLLEGRGGEEVRAFEEAELREHCARPVPESAAALAARRPRLEARLRRALGWVPEPEGGPLAARVTGSLVGPGCRVDKVVLESRPRFPVTLHAWIPASAGPFPAVLVVPGHGRAKKEQPAIQEQAAALAAAGFLAVVVDGPGLAYEGDVPVERRGAGSHNDFAIALGAGGATGFLAWDLHRVLDWLQTVPEADLERVGILGFGEGGRAAAWTFVLDPRIRCAVLSSAVPAAARSPYRACLCGHEPGLLAAGDLADYLALRAPAPVLVLAARGDAQHPAEAVRATFERLQALYGVQGAADAVRFTQLEGRRADDPALREAALDFLRARLRPPSAAVGSGPEAAGAEASFQPWKPDDPALRVLPPGTEQGRSMADWSRARLAARVERSWTREEALAFFDAPAAKAPRVLLDRPAGASGDRHLILEARAGLRLPAVLHPARGGTARAVAVLLTERGKQAAATEFPLDALQEAGISCLAVDVRGFGELQGLDPRLLLSLGRPAALGMGEDLAAFAAFARSLAPQVVVVGKGPVASLAALFAGLQDPQLDLVVGLDSLRSLDEFFAGDVPIFAIVPGAGQGPSLAALRRILPVDAVWRFRDGTSPPSELAAILSARLAGK